MRRVVIGCLALGGLVLLAASAFGDHRNCDPSTLGNSQIALTELKLPTKLIKTLTGGLIDVGVQIILDDDYSLNLGQHCDCTPPCEEGSFQYSSVQATGETTAFGGTVKWTEELFGCEPGIGGPEADTQSLTLEGSYTEGTGRWNAGVSASVLGVGLVEKGAMFAFSFDTACRCQDEPCALASYPKASASPEQLHLIRGETGHITITATDDNQDLRSASIAFAQTADSPVAVDPGSGGGPGGQNASETFAIVCRDTTSLEASIRFVVRDQQGNKTSLEVPLTIWRGRPSIEIDEAETGWENGSYVTCFRLDDPDFADCDRRAEYLIWGVTSVRGGDILSWPGTETCDTQKVSDGGELHAVVFSPSQEPGAQSFTLWAEDLAGHRTELLITVDRKPQARDDEAANCVRGTCSDQVTGNVLANDMDVDGDTLEAILKTIPEHGQLTSFDEKTGAFTYIPDVVPAAGHDPLQDSFTYVVRDGSGTSDRATVSLTIYPLPGAEPKMSVGDPRPCSCPSGAEGAGYDTDLGCACAEISIRDDDFEIPWAYESVALAASCVAGSGGAYLQGLGTGGWSLWEDEISLSAPATGAPLRGEVAFAREADVYDLWYRIGAVDSQGHEIQRTLTIRFDTDPETFSGTWLPEGNTVYTQPVACTGRSVFYEEPAWWETGCVQFRDLDGDPLTIRISSQGRFGRAETYTRRIGDTYSVTVQYEVDGDAVLAAHRAREPLWDRVVIEARDPSGDRASHTMKIEFEVINGEPVAQADAASTLMNTPITIDVLANDSDPDGDPLEITGIEPPSDGTVSIVGSSIRYTPNPGHCGFDLFGYMVDDGFGGTDTALVDVEIIDTVDPVAVCQNVTLYLDDNGEATLDPANLDGGSTDNCGISEFSASKTEFDCDDRGTVTVWLTVIDYAGNEDTCQATVTVEDNTPPIAVGQSITIALDANGHASIAPADVDAGSFDNCSFSLSLDKTDFTCADLGENTVRLTATDVGNKTHYVDVVVTVVDETAPVARCRDITVALDANGSITLADNAVDNGSTDNCGIDSFFLSPNSFGCAEVGAHSVTMTVTDTRDNESSCTATVTVQDVTPPDMTPPGNKTVTANPGHCYATGVSLGTPSATDACGVDWGTLGSNAPSQFPVGTTTVTWTVDDIHGNTGSCTQHVTVTEPVAPNISCPGDIHVETDNPSGEIVTFSVSASDNCDSNPSVSCSPSSGSRFPVGTTTVTCTARDSSNNTDTCTFHVTVDLANRPPVANDVKVVVIDFSHPVDVKLSAYDPDGDPITYHILSGPSLGYLTGTAPNLTYHRTAGGPTEDYFTYRVYDGESYSNIAYAVIDP